MNLRKNSLSIRFALLVLVAPLVAIGVRAEKIEQLSPQGYVNDFSGALDPETRQRLTDLCQEVDQKANAQIAVVTIHSLEGDTVQDFANRLFMKWGVGPKGSDRGVMILVAVDDHQYWTEVGYGLEPILPDGKVGGFGREMVPLLRQNQYSAAVLRLTSEIANVIAKDRGISLTQSVSSPANQRGPEESPQGTLPFLINMLALLIIFMVFGWRFLAFLSVVTGWPPYRRGRGYRGGGWIGPVGGWGGGSGGGSWGGGGFGGFGGGSSGGGGAGGSW